ncbi:MFS transporter [Phenylobacterium sp.]|jgi:MFS family permease|uniref:MFS transporter n=1 Tax=Phenylobacterium sp. TaxID=1871053 RepID=UPI0037CAC4D7
MTTETAAKPLREAFSPFIVPLLAAAVFINYVDRGGLATAAPLIKDELALTSTQIGILISAFFWTYTPGLVLSGWMADRFNAYKTLAAGLAIWSLATFFSGFAAGFVALLMLRLLLGVGESAAFPVSSTLIARHVPAARLGAANGLIIVGLSLGPAVGIFFGGHLMETLGWRGVFIMFGAISLLWLVPWLLVTGRLTDRGAADHEPGAGPSFPDIFRRPELWGASLGHFSVNFAFYFVVSWIPLYLVKSQGYTLGEMANVGGGLYLVYAGGSFLSGWLSDRWIATGATPNRARKTIFVCAHLVTAAGLLACAYVAPQVAIGCLFVVAFALGAVGPHIFATGQTLAGPKAAGKWIGVQNGWANFAGILGPIITGMIVDSTGSFHAAFIVTAAGALLGVAGWGLMIRKIEPVPWKAG